MTKRDSYSLKSLWPIFSDLSINCVSNNITLRLEQSSHVVAADGISSSGYFTSEPHPVLAVAVGKPMQQWLPVVLHESSHMDQFLENCEQWKQLTLPDGNDAVEQLFEWTAGKILHSTGYVTECVRRTINVELDCEIRTLHKIKKYSVGDIINPNDYIKQANSYIYFYSYVLLTGKFYTPGKEPYNNPKVWKHAPSQFNSLEDYMTIPAELLEAFKRHC